MTSLLTFSNREPLSLSFGGGNVARPFMTSRKQNTARALTASSGCYTMFHKLLLRRSYNSVWPSLRTMCQL